MAGLVSPRATIETLGVFKHLLADVLGSDQIGLLYGAAPQDLGPKASLNDVAGADCIVLVGGEPLDGQKVVGYKVKRAVDLGAALTIVADGPNLLDPWAQKRLPMSELAKSPRSSRPRCGRSCSTRPGLPGETYAFLRSLPEKVKYLPLVEGTNAAGAAQAGHQDQGRSRAMRSSCWPPTRSTDGHDAAGRAASPWCRPRTGRRRSSRPTLCCPRWTGPSSRDTSSTWKA